MTLRQQVNNCTLTQVQIAEIVGCSRSTIQRAIANPEKYPEIVDGIEKTIGAPPATIKNENKLTFHNGMLNAVRIVNTNPANLTLDEIVELFEIDITKWECYHYEIADWNTSMKVSEGVPGVVKNYSVRAKFRPRKDWSLTKSKDFTWIFDTLKNYAPCSEPTFRPQEYKEDEKMLMLPIFDLHFGKLAWEDETGSHYDIKIARERFLTSIRDLLFRASREGFDKIVFPIGSDFFNAEATGKTHHGTPQDNDTRYKRMLRDGITLLLDAINVCKDYAPVEVLFVPGNHDTDISFAAYEAVRGWLNNEEDIVVNEDIKTRKYYKWGVNLLGITHGDKEKDRLYELMQHEAREWWGQTIYAEWIIGHYHRSYVDEKLGVRKTTVPSLSGTDAWHYEKGYTGSLKGAIAITYHKDHPGAYTTYHYYLGGKRV